MCVCVCVRVRVCVHVCVCACVRVHVKYSGDLFQRKLQVVNTPIKGIKMVLNREHLIHEGLAVSRQDKVSLIAIQPRHQVLRHLRHTNSGVSYHDNRDDYENAKLTDKIIGIRIGQLSLKSRRCSHAHVRIAPRLHSRRYACMRCFSRVSLRCMLPSVSTQAGSQWRYLEASMRGSRRAHIHQQAMQVRLLGTHALNVLHVSPPRHLPLHLCVCVCVCVCLSVCLCGFRAHRCDFKIIRHRF